MEIIIIVGHGNPEKESSNTAFIADNLHGMIHSECKKKCVRVAYLQFMEPDLMGAIKNAVQDRAEKIIVHPYFLSSGYHVAKNIPEIIKNAKGLFPDAEFICTRHLGAHHKLSEVVLERIKEAADL